MAPAAWLRLLSAAGARGAGQDLLGYPTSARFWAAFYRAGIGGPRTGRCRATSSARAARPACLRALAWLTSGDPAALEGSLDDGLPHLAYNIAVLSSVLGSTLEPDFTGHALMLEEIGEYMYRIDRYLFHITSSPQVRRAAGIRMGRVGETPRNDPDIRPRGKEAVVARLVRQIRHSLPGPRRHRPRHRQQGGAVRAALEES
jgi:muramoyltetrapeptide carboxypeptidase